MSVYSNKTGIKSSLKPYCSDNIKRAKTAVLNKVRFTTPKKMGIIESVRVALEEKKNFVCFLVFLRKNVREFPGNSCGKW